MLSTSTNQSLTNQNIAQNSVSVRKIAACLKLPPTKRLIEPTQQPKAQLAQDGRDHLSKLPTELLHCIFDNLDRPASVILGLACSRFYAIHQRREPGMVDLGEISKWPRLGGGIAHAELFKVLMPWMVAAGYVYNDVVCCFVRKGGEMDYCMDGCTDVDVCTEVCMDVCMTD